MSSPSSLFSASSTTSSVAYIGEQDDEGHAPCASLDHLSTAVDGIGRTSSDCQVSVRERLASVSRGTPPIPGLYVFPGFLSANTAQSVLSGIAEADHFHGGARDQVMLFTPPPESSIPAALPKHLDDLLHALSEQLHNRIPHNVHHTVFSQPLARQAILNLYPPGQGITAHIDLPHRYADGILGVSLIGGTVMDFTHHKKGTHSVYLPARSIYVLSGEARWAWKHGIAGRDRDVVDGVTILRDLRVSVTFRWMKEGGDVLS